jgi:hypothetical protein
MLKDRPRRQERAWIKLYPGIGVKDGKLLKNKQEVNKFIMTQLQ